MDRAPRVHRTPRRMLSVLATFALVGGTLVALAPGADAGVNSCRARNITQDGRSNSNLQTVIDAASPGDTIAVKYVCVGNFQVSKKLTLVGKATPGISKAVLSASGAGRVLLISARVTLTNLKITRGQAYTGGGIYNDHGTVTLKRATVTRNSAHGGGGIFNRAGTVTLNDSVVSWNTATGYPGGIFTTGILTLNGSSSVRHNTARQSGGGIYSANGTTTLNDTSSVVGNRAGYEAGGILQKYGKVILNDSSSVRGNASSYGGGIFTSSVVTLNGASSVSGNNARSYGGGIYNQDGSLTMNGSSLVEDNTSRLSGGGILSEGGTVTLNDSASATGNTADFDNDGSGSGGGVRLKSKACLVGAVDGGNVNDNFLGNGNENNITGTSICI